MYGIIATWCMALDGVEEAYDHLSIGCDAGDAIERAICRVEDVEYYKSVGYGGLPNEEMEVELDAAYMDGDTLAIGCVAALKDFANPIQIARCLSKEEVNNFLVGRGAEKYAQQHGFMRKNMLTQRAKALYHERVKEMTTSGLQPYTGHDTVGMVCLDQHTHMIAATSTSGLFMKRAGRVGDSPVIGSGLYVDSSVGGASATGLGEDLMKGCISYEIVRLMKEGKTPQEACDIAVLRFDEQLRQRRKKAGDMSLIAMNNKGEWGVATNIDTFSFVVATQADPLQVYLARRDSQGHTQYEKASTEWIAGYVQQRSAPYRK